MNINSILATVCMATVPFISSSDGMQQATENAKSPKVGYSASAQTQKEEARTTVWRQEASGLARFPSYFGLNQEQRKRDQEIAEAAKNLRQSNSDAERTSAISDLEDLLSSDYDERLQSYDDYLKGLEERLAEMRANLQKRREAKNAMIQLRIKVLESEADDLGWPERMSNRSTSTLRTIINKAGQQKASGGR